MKRRFTLAFALVAASALAGCAHKPPVAVKPHVDVDHQLAPGEWGLRKLLPSQYPDMRMAFMNKQGLMKAIDRSIMYLRAPSSRQFFPSGPITHAQVLASLEDMKLLLTRVQSPDVFQQQILQRYDVYTSKGYDDRGSVWFTGYYTPIFHGSLHETATYRYPIYKRPNDLVSNPITGAILGQRMPNGAVRPYPTRRQIVTQHLLKGDELAWFKDPLEPYIIQVQGSAKIKLPDGRTLMVGYAGKNGRSYHGLGQELVADGKLRKRQLSLPAIMQYFKTHPGEENHYIMLNKSFAFLAPYKKSAWPLGSLGVKVTALRTLATDKSIFPRAALTFVSTSMPNGTGAVGRFRQFLLDQDTGGAIRAAGRADIYMGIGPQAGDEAGHEFSQGRLYYIFLKPRFVGQYQTAASANGNAAGAGYAAPAGRAGGVFQPAPANGSGR